MVANHPARFKVLACGRRWGKTRLGTILCLEAALKGGRAWWVAPSYSIASVGWRGMKDLAKQIPGADVREHDKLINFPKIGSESAMVVRTADDPETLVGEGLDFLVIDESGKVKRQAWFESLRPALADKSGRALIIGTPKKRNWFFDEYTRGQDPEEKHYQSWKFPSYANPFFPSHEWDAAKAQMPSEEFRQEMEAEFLLDSAGVFRGVGDIMSGGEAKSEGPWVIGADIAKHTDFTVMIVMDRKTGQCIEMDRFNKVDWNIQKQRIHALSMKHGRARVYLDATGIGDPIYDELRMNGVNVQGVKLSTRRKSDLVQSLVLSIEQGKIKFPSEWEVLANELYRYEYTTTQFGNTKYSAPSGHHDDCVIALGLANFGRNRSRAWVAA